MKRKIILAFSLCVIKLEILSQIKALSYLPFESTITFELLKLDENIFGKKGKEIAVCKQLMECAANRIKKAFPNKSLKELSTEDAISVLKIIDSTFTEFGFLFHTDSQDIEFDYLSLAFKKRPVMKTYFQVNFGNNSRSAYWTLNPLEKCRLIDCDLYCEIYVGIAQMLDLPIFMAQTPKHIYLRWHKPSGEYFCWDATDGKEYLNEKDVFHYGRIDDFNRKQYIKSWTLNDILGYYYGLQGCLFNFEKKYFNLDKTKFYYEKAIELRPNFSAILNNYVWLHVLSKKLNTKLDTSALLVHINNAIDIIKSQNYYDAKACLYSSVGDFQKAIDCEVEGAKYKSFYDEERISVQAMNHLECFTN